MPQPDVISANEFMDWLEERGIIPTATRHVIIDARMDEPLVIYVDQLGTREIISADPPAILPAQVRLIEDPDG